MCAIHSSKNKVSLSTLAVQREQDSVATSFYQHVHIASSSPILHVRQPATVAMDGVLLNRVYRMQRHLRYQSSIVEQGGLPDVLRRTLHLKKDRHPDSDKEDAGLPGQHFPPET